MHNFCIIFACVRVSCRPCAHAGPPRAYLMLALPAPPRRARASPAGYPRARLLPAKRARAVSCLPTQCPVRASPRVDGVPFERVVDGVNELAPAETVRAFHATEPCSGGYRPSKSSYAPAETVRAFHATEPCSGGYRPSKAWQAFQAILQIQTAKLPPKQRGRIDAYLLGMARGRRFSCRVLEIANYPNPARIGR